MDVAKNIQKKVEAFDCFINKNILKRSCQAYQQTCKKRPENKNLDEWLPMDTCKMKGAVRLFYLIGVYCFLYKFLCSLWSSGPSGRPIFSAFLTVIGLRNLKQNFDNLEDSKTGDNLLPFEECENPLLKIAKNIMQLARMQLCTNN